MLKTIWKASRRRPGNIIRFRDGRPRRFATLILLCASAASAVGVVAGASHRIPASASSGTLDSDPAAISQALDQLPFRLIGPSSPAGRVWQVVGVPPKDGRGITTTFYVCTAGGGVWKSTDAGTTLKPIFNNEASGSCGAVAVAPSDPDQVWVGTGEPSSTGITSMGHGVFHSMNGGQSWQTAGLDDTEEISAIVIDPANPNVVYVAALGHLWGRNPQRGIFKTADGGKSWMRVLFVDDATGFSDLAMDPHDSQTLYAAAWQRIRWGAGDMTEFGPGSGIFKTTDGGGTWVRLSNGLPTACNYSPPRPLGEKHEARGDAATNNAGGKRESNQESAAAGSKTDRAEERDEAGEKERAEDQSKNGNEERIQADEETARAQLKQEEKDIRAALPPAGQSCMGKITIAIAPNNSKIVYAAILTGQQRRLPEWMTDQNAVQRTSMDGGTFRSDDAGAHWRRVGSAMTSYYHDRITADPSDDHRVWMPVFALLRSQDGAETFSSQNMDNVHNDLHTIWVDPLDPDHMILGGDGGVYSTFNAGRSWMQHVLPIAQFYKVAVDDQEPYWVYGGMQDTAHWAGPSRTYDKEGITSYDWYKLRHIGDGMSIAPDPHDPNILYMVSELGNTARLDQRTWTRHELQPPDSMAAKLGLHPFRWDWNSPLLILFGGSPDGSSQTLGQPSDEAAKSGAAVRNAAHGAAVGSGASTTFLLGANYVFRCKVPLHMPLTPDSYGEKYCRVISPDLSAQQTKMPHGFRDGYHSFGALSVLAQSPVDARVLWAGADDGPLWVSRDNGANWTKAGAAAGAPPAAPGQTQPTLMVDRMPQDAVVAHIEASRSDAGAAYAVLDRHTLDDSRPYIYYTHNFGTTWSDVTGDLPKYGPAYVIREDPKNSQVLYAGTEFGLYVSLNQGSHWTRWSTDLPMAPVRTLAIQPRDRELVAGTFGRGIYIADIGPMPQLAAALRSKTALLFDAGSAIAFHMRYTYGTNVEQLNGDMFFRAPNPPYGAPLYYYLSRPYLSGVRLNITDAQGKFVRSLLEPSTPGFHAVHWDLDWQLQILMGKLKYRTTTERMEHPEIQDDELKFTYDERLARRLVPAGAYYVTLQANDAPGASPDKLPPPLAPPVIVRVKDEDPATSRVGSIRK
jgi:photosystem II stability/assembly factor-like uncharacterized protein